MEKEELTVATYNIGDIYADETWNDTRWGYILDKIQEKSADLIILHEVNDNSMKTFDKLLDGGYISHIPYKNRSYIGHVRDSWEVVYSKYPVLFQDYIPLSSHEGLSCLKCVCAQTYEVDIYASTWNPNKKGNIEALSFLTSKAVDLNRPMIISISSNNLGSLMVPPKGIKDVWSLLGKRASINITLNKNLRRNLTDRSLRGDHLWIKHIRPINLELLHVDQGAEHHGLYFTCQVSSISDVLLEISCRKPRSKRKLSLITGSGVNLLKRSNRDINPCRMM